MILNVANLSRILNLSSTSTDNWPELTIGFSYKLFKLQTTREEVKEIIGSNPFSCLNSMENMLLRSVRFTFDSQLMTCLKQPNSNLEYSLLSLSQTKQFLAN